MTFVYYAPAHTRGRVRRIPKGTILVACDQQPGATSFGAYPERYDELEEALVPDSERVSSGYAGGYAVSLPVEDIGDLLEPIEPADPRPTRNQLPRVSRMGSWPE